MQTTSVLLHHELQESLANAKVSARQHWPKTDFDIMT